MQSESDMVDAVVFFEPCTIYNVYTAYLLIAHHMTH